MDIEAVYKNHEAELLAIPEVAHVGIGEKDGHNIILIFIKKGKSASTKIPKEIDGYKTEIREQMRLF